MLSSFKHSNLNYEMLCLFKKKQACGVSKKIVYINIFGVIPTLLLVISSAHVK